MQHLIAVLRRAFLIAGVALTFTGPLRAASVPAVLPPPVAVQTATVRSVPAPAKLASTVIPALTPIALEIAVSLSSKTSKPGDRFPIRLNVPLVVDGVIAVPAGTTGMGEVIEAKGGGMSGSAGVLILATRYLDCDGRRLKLRSMHVMGVGADRSTLADAVGIAVGFPGLFITGGATKIAAGTIAQAKTAEDFQLGGPTGAGASAEPASGAVIPAPATHDLTNEGKTQ